MLVSGSHGQNTLRASVPSYPSLSYPHFQIVVTILSYFLLISLLWSSVLPSCIFFNLCVIPNLCVCHCKQLIPLFAKTASFYNSLWVQLGCGTLYQLLQYFVLALTLLRILFKFFVLISSFCCQYCCLLVFLFLSWDSFILSAAIGAFFFIICFSIKKNIYSYRKNNEGQRSYCNYSWQNVTCL